MQLVKVASISDSELDLRSHSGMGDVVDREGRKSTIKMGRAGPSPMQGSISGAGTPGPGPKIDKRLAQVQVWTFTVKIQLE